MLATRKDGPVTLTPSEVTGNVDLQELFDSLLHSISHDLRSPLLTMSLSAELIADHLSAGPGDAPRPTVALEALNHGAKDLERMLQAVTLLSRARRRSLDDNGVRLGVLLGGHIVLSEVSDLERRTVAVDPLVVREIVDVLAGDAPVEIRAAVEDRHVVLQLPGTERTSRIASSPLQALVGSLHAYAGTEVETLAVAEFALARQGATLRADGESVRLALPLSVVSR